MKTTSILLVLLFLIQNKSFMQDRFGEQKIIASDPYARPYHAYAVDIDNDDDFDILVAWKDEKVVWYENIDGKGNFSSERIITSSNVHSYSINAEDIDNDGKKDIIVLSNTARWYQNLGNGNFANPIDITETCGGFIPCVNFSDFNGDNYLDIVSLNSSISTSLVLYTLQDGGISYIKKQT